MMETEFLLASNNAHKHQEFVRLFPGIHVLMPRELGIEFDFDETGDTFLENAYGKAMALFHNAKRPVMGDDSGLCVQALGGEPGILSSRYGSGAGGVVLDAPRRNAYLLDRMEGIQDRAAYFVCCLVLVLDESRFVAVQETVHGRIAEGPRGENGFGYDPLFIVPGHEKTIAELPDQVKDSISHRGLAARRILTTMRGES
ncbi:MAG: RdgB/HAM1 family non-canonical purine NTP pyrophosphatase [Spirochaetia bacterium]|jgi:XTP/dITP diphosphohydrolase